MWAIIGAGVIAALLIAGLGAFVVIRVLSLPSGLAGIGRACTGSVDPAGSSLQTGDRVCGYRLGPALVNASCVDAASIPDGLRAWQQGPEDAEPTTASIALDDEGCNLNAPTRTSVWLETTGPNPPDVVVIADYYPHTDWGLIGIELGCTRETCLNLYVDPAGAYRLDELRATRSWHTIARGPLPVFTISKLGQLNRMVVRYHDREFDAFLDGYTLVRTTTDIALTPGAITFYSSDRIGTEAALVHLRTLDVFGTT